ncbi:MAG TPA: ACT domain-containing protein [Candidatus Binatus sp.]|nr:ACT domain-containing protein [Candidatus Binatus sp.]
MASFRLRVALPDRPGALGAVASRIGAVGGDVVSVAVVDRSDESAVHEFIVELADEARLGLLLSEVVEGDGVSVEEFHPIPGRGRDRRLDPYDTAVAILRERTPQDVLGALAERAVAELDATWSAVLDVEDAIVIASSGRHPAAPWLVPYLGLARPPAGRPDTGDVGWVDLAAWDLVLLVGRPGWRLGTSDFARLEAMAGLADARWGDLAERDARVSHPAWSHPNRAG